MEMEIQPKCVPRLQRFMLNNRNNFARTHFDYWHGKNLFDECSARTTITGPLIAVAHSVSIGFKAININTRTEFIIIIFVSLSL